MAILKFERTASCTIPIYGQVSKDDAEIYANVAAAADNLDASKMDSDCFTALTDTKIPAELDLRCFGGPFSVDPKSIWITGNAPDGVNTIHFKASQDCIFFAEGIQFEAAAEMAYLASQEDRIEQSLQIDATVPHRWVISAPEGFPQSVLIDCFARDVEQPAPMIAYVPQKRREAI